MGKFIVVSCVEREMCLLGQTNSYKEAFEMMVADFIRFHSNNSVIEDIVEGLNVNHLESVNTNEKDVVEAILKRFDDGASHITDFEWEVSAFSCWSNLVSDENYDCKIFDTEELATGAAYLIKNVGEKKYGT